MRQFLLNCLIIKITVVPWTLKFRHKNFSRRKNKFYPAENSVELKELRSVLPIDLSLILLGYLSGNSSGGRVAEPEYNKKIPTCVKGFAQKF
jgi:hypothetical protein